MHRRQYVIAIGTALSTGFAGCLGGGDGSTPDSLVIEGKTIETQGTNTIVATVTVENPTEETIDEKRVWVQLRDQENEPLDTGSAGLSPLDPGQSGAIPVTFSGITYNSSDVSDSNTVAVITDFDANSPFES